MTTGEHLDTDLDDALDDQDNDEGTGPSGNALRNQRERIKRLEADLATEREARLAQAFQLAGFDPTTGPGKLVAKAYDGEPDAEAIRAFATEHGIVVAPVVDTTRVDAQARVAEVIGASDSLGADRDLEAEIAVAEAEGDHAKAMNLRMQLVDKLRET